MKSTKSRQKITSLQQLNRRIVRCTLCPRLVSHRESISKNKPRRYLDWEYWGKPLTGFGDPSARVLLLGLAPAAHGGNRTGRMFTGDRSGDWLARALYEHGFASQLTSTESGDGLTLKDCYVTAAARCAPPNNRPLPEELRRCEPYLIQELGLLPNLSVVIALGQIAFHAALRSFKALGVSVPSPQPRFAHGAVYRLSGFVLLASYHPSQQNTLTGRLTRPMFHSIFKTALDVLPQLPKSMHLGLTSPNTPH